MKIYGLLIIEIDGEELRIPLQNLTEVEKVTSLVSSVIQVNPEMNMYSFQSLFEIIGQEVELYKLPEKSLDSSAKKV